MEPISTTAFALQAVSFIGNLFGARAAARRSRRVGMALAQDAIARGEESAFAYSGNINRIIGRQRTAIAAQNIDVTHGSARKVVEEARAFGDRDLATIRLNAAREARMLQATAKADARNIMNQSYGQALAQAGSLLTSGRDAWRVWSTGRGGAPALDPLLTRRAQAPSPFMVGMS